MSEKTAAASGSGQALLVVTHPHHQHAQSMNEILASSPAGIIGLLVALAAELWFLRLIGDQVQGRMLFATQSSTKSKVLLYPLMAPGVALHELGHAVAALCCGARVRKIVLFHPQRTDDGGYVLGYVSHDEPRTLIGRTFVALAPLVLPPLFLYLLAAAIVPGVHGLVSPFTVFADAFTHPTLLTVLWLLLFAAMTLSNFPSDHDFQSLGYGLYIVAAVSLLPALIALADHKDAAAAISPYTILATFLAPSLLAGLIVLSSVRLHEGLGQRR